MKQQSPKPPKIPLRLLERHPTALHTRSRSAPSLHAPSDRRKVRGPRAGNSRDYATDAFSPTPPTPNTDQVFWPSQEDFQYSMGSLVESKEELDTAGKLFQDTKFILQYSFRLHVLSSFYSEINVRLTFCSDYRPH